MRRKGCDLRKWRWQLCLSWTQMMKATRQWAQTWTSWNTYRIQRGIFSWVLLQGFDPLMGIDKYFHMHLPTCVSNIIGLCVWLWGVPSLVIESPVRSWSLTSRGLNRDWDQSTKAPIPQKTGLDWSKTGLDWLLVLTSLNRFKTGLSLKIRHIFISNVCWG